LLALLDKWNVTLSESPARHERANGGVLVVAAGHGELVVQLILEPAHPHAMVRVEGADSAVAELTMRAAHDVWSRNELMIRLTASDPPDSALLVPVALITEALDHPTVEIFLRALESDERSTRTQAIMAISLVPALAFAPALAVALERETDEPR